MSNKVEITSFQDWLDKYFGKPKLENIYKVKNGSEYFRESELLAKYKKSVGKK